MDKLEKVELIRQKTGVGYDDAKAALDTNNDDVLDAIVWLERMGKTHTSTTSYTTGVDNTKVGESRLSPEMERAQYAYEESTRKKTFGERFDSAWAYIRNLFRKGLSITFVAERNGSRAIELPVTILVIGLFFWGATFWLLIAGLFCGFRYHLEGMDSAVSVNLNDAMNKAADGAESIKNALTEDEARTDTEDAQYKES